LFRGPAPKSVSEIMTKKVVTISPNKTLMDAAKIMYEKKIGSLAVLDDNNKLVGILTKSDLTRATSLGIDPKVATVEKFMSTPVITASPEASIAEVSKMMHENRVRHILVVNFTGELVGIIASYDLTFYRVFHVV